VQFFTVGRRGVGSITWEGTTDLTGDLNLDKIIKVRCSMSPPGAYTRPLFSSTSAVLVTYSCPPI